MFCGLDLYIELNLQFLHIYNKRSIVMNIKGKITFKEENNRKLKKIACYFRFNDKEEVEKCKQMLKISGFITKKLI